MKRLLLLAVLLFNAAMAGLACTTVVVSGKYTTDGRPILWKLRDTESYRNKMRYFTDGKFPYLGLTDSDDAEGLRVWSGSNAAGFSIMNSASFNVNLDDTSSYKDREGEFMKLALKKCASLADFEQLLNERPKPMGLAAHFGVIDAHGGAAFYEVNNHTWTKFDANDPLAAPQGYLLRTNFSFTGKKDTGYGFIRFQTAQDQLYAADASRSLNYRTFLQKLSRCTIHPVLKADYRKTYSALPYGENFVSSDDLITRFGSASNMVIVGVKPGEPADMSTLWTMVGFPLASTAIPLWVRGGDTFPDILKASGDENSPANEWALKLKEKIFPIGRSDGYHYMQASELFNREGTGIVQQIERFENTLFDETDRRLVNWLKAAPKAAEITAFYNELNRKTTDFYRSNWRDATER